MTIESHTDLDIRMAVSDCFNKGSLDDYRPSAYQLLVKYLRRTHEFTHDQIDEVVDRLEEQVAEHIIEIHEEQNA